MTKGPSYNIMFMRPITLETIKEMEHDFRSRYHLSPLLNQFARDRMLQASGTAHIAVGDKGSIQNGLELFLIHHL
jgi:hypothetical protein